MLRRPHRACVGGALPVRVCFVFPRVGRSRGNVVEGVVIERVALLPMRARRLLAEYPDPQIVVHTLAAPSGGRGVVVDVDTQFGVAHPQVLPVILRRRRAANDFEVPSVRVQETPATAVLGFNDDFPLMYQTMMQSA